MKTCCVTIPALSCGVCAGIPSQLFRLTIDGAGGSRSGKRAREPKRPGAAGMPPAAIEVTRLPVPTARPSLNPLEAMQQLEHGAADPNLEPIYDENGQWIGLKRKEGASVASVTPPRPLEAPAPETYPLGYR